MQKIGASGLPLPRFVSIKALKANVRVGPGRNYPISWVYQRQGLPVEIIQEYDSWRKIRDSDGQGGWVYRSLLSNKRTALVMPWCSDKKIMHPLHKDPSESSSPVAFVQSAVVVELDNCDGLWCGIYLEGKYGFMKQEELWGLYPGEIIK